MSVSARNMILSQSGDTAWISELTATGAGGSSKPVTIRAPYRSDLSSGRVYFYFNSSDSGELVGPSANVDFITGNLLGDSQSLFDNFNYDFSAADIGPFVFIAFRESGGTSRAYVVNNKEYGLFNNPFSSVLSDTDSTSNTSAIVWYDAGGTGPDGAYLSIYNNSLDTLKTSGRIFNDPSTTPVNRVVFNGSDVFVLRPTESGTFPTSNGTSYYYDFGGDDAVPASDNTIFVSTVSSNEVSVRRFDPSTATLSFVKRYTLGGSLRFSGGGYITIDPSDNVYVLASIEIDDGGYTSYGCAVLKLTSDGTVDWCNILYSTTFSSGSVYSPRGILHDGDSSIIVTMGGASEVILKLPDSGALADASKSYLGVVYAPSPGVSTITSSIPGVTESTGSISYTSNTAGATAIPDSLTFFTLNSDSEEI